MFLTNGQLAFSSTTKQPIVHLKYSIRYKDLASESKLKLENPKMVTTVFCTHIAYTYVHKFLQTILLLMFSRIDYVYLFAL